MCRKYSGMTVNERLYVSGLMEQFDNAVIQKDIKKVIIVLKQVELDGDSIISILKELKLWNEIPEL
jgi:anti-anti-sigma regulatory factor